MPHQLDPDTDTMYAWCFSHGRMHRFDPEEPWCTATWIRLDAGSEAEALTVKQERYGDARFVGDLPLHQQAGLVRQAHQ